MPVYTAGIDALEEYPIEKRIAYLLTEAINNIKLNPHETILVHTLLPEKDSYRGLVIKPGLIEYIYKDILDLNNCFLQFSDASEDCSKTLIDLTHKLKKNEVDGVLFVGVDSLIDSKTINELMVEKKIMTADSMDGIAPGEAAAVCLLRLKSENNTQDFCEVVPHALFEAEDIDHIITANIQTREKQVQWFQACRKIWKPPLKTPETIMTHITLGEIGAASLPFCLALATLGIRPSQTFFVHEKQNGESTEGVCIHRRSQHACNSEIN